MKKIYLGCALHNASQEYRASIELLQDLIESFPEVELLKFKSKPTELGDFTSKEIYEYDREMVGSADMMIAEASNPSLGLGMETMIAIQREIPVYVIHQEDAAVSKMIRGTADVHDFVTLRTYKNSDDLKTMMTEILG
jgi:nucleoside 2-deoxyribosyltransferase